MHGALPGLPSLPPSLPLSRLRLLWAAGCCLLVGGPQASGGPGCSCAGHTTYHIRQQSSTHQRSVLPRRLGQRGGRCAAMPLYTNTALAAASRPSHPLPLLHAVPCRAVPPCCCCCCCCPGCTLTETCPHKLNDQAAGGRRVRGRAGQSLPSAGPTGREGQICCLRGDKRNTVFLILYRVFLSHRVRQPSALAWSFPACHMLPPPPAAAPPARLPTGRSSKGQG